MIDSFSGAKLEQINQARHAQNKNHFYPQHTRMSKVNTAAASAYDSNQVKQEETKSRVALSKASHIRDPDGLDSVSQVSVSTPKSRTGNSSESVSFVSR